MLSSAVLTLQVQHSRVRGERGEVLVLAIRSVQVLEVLQRLEVGLTQL